VEEIREKTEAEFALPSTAPALEACLDDTAPGRSHGMSLKEQFGKDILLTGWGHSRFGKLTDETLESLIVQVATEAIATPASSRARSTRSTSASSTPA
jgi:hypothetical protein